MINTFARATELVGPHFWCWLPVRCLFSTRQAKRGKQRDLRDFLLWPISSPSIVSITYSLHVLGAIVWAIGLSKRGERMRVRGRCMQPNPFSMLILIKRKRVWKLSQLFDVILWRRNHSSTGRKKILSFLRNYGFLSTAKTHTHAKRLLHSP